MSHSDAHKLQLTHSSLLSFTLALGSRERRLWRESYFELSAGGGRECELMSACSHIH